MALYDARLGTGSSQAARHVLFLGLPPNCERAGGGAYLTGSRRSYR